MTIADNKMHKASKKESVGLSHTDYPSLRDTCRLLARAGFDPREAEEFWNAAEGDFQKFERLVYLRTVARIPKEYVLGELTFCGQKFVVDQRAYISDHWTELLVHRAVEVIQNIENRVVLLDVGCGAGSIGLSVTLFVPNRIRHLLLADISCKALEVCRLNVQAYANVRECFPSFSIHESDLLTSIPNEIRTPAETIDLRKSYTLIVCDPPYGSPDRDKMVSRGMLEKAAHVPKESIWGPHGELFNIHVRLFSEILSRSWKAHAIIECGRYDDAHLREVLPTNIDWQHVWLDEEYSVVEAIYQP